jgi:hypothetical protein
MAVITHRDCRALRHAWERMAGQGEEPLPDSPLWHAARYVIFLRCMRCETWRYVAIDHRGARLASAYRYPDDYLRPKGEPRANPDDLRLWLAKPTRNGRR